MYPSLWEISSYILILLNLCLFAMSIVSALIRLVRQEPFYFSAPVRYALYFHYFYLAMTIPMIFSADIYRPLDEPFLVPWAFILVFILLLWLPALISIALFRNAYKMERKRDVISVSLSDD